MKKISTQAYFVKNYSIINSGKRLKKFLYDNYDRLNIDPRNVDQITPEFSKKILNNVNLYIIKFICILIYDN